MLTAAVWFSMLLQQSSLPSAPPAPIWGVTLDDLTYVGSIKKTLTAFKKKVTARVVFDPGMHPADYLPALKTLGTTAYLMGEPVDSYDAATYTPSAYRARMAEFMDGVGSFVSIWEVGNEVNGDWTGKVSDQVARITAGVQEAQKRKRPTALTLFYSDDFLGTNREMVTWSNKYLGATLRSQFDYVLVSFYPTRATGKHPNWPTIFTNLAKAFPNAKLGFGELGLANPDGSLSTSQSGKTALIQRYYPMTPPISNRYIGGYFWWNFAEDAVPTTRALWSVFDGCIR